MAATTDVGATDSLKVFCRVRPTPSATTRKCVTVENASHIVVNERKFTLDWVADEGETQEAVFDRVGKPMADAFLAGFNGCIFAYGQTGSGKTYTIQGPIDSADGAVSKEAAGLLPRCIDYIFQRKAELEAAAGGALTISCKASYLEIYNEKVYDLQVENVVGGTGSAGMFAPVKDTSLTLREHAVRGVYVEGLTEVAIGAATQAHAVVATGIKNRKVAATAMNHESSRSHSVFTLTLESQERKENGVLKSRFSSFHLIDLAGSERQDSAKTTGERLKEASQINKSLSTLAGVISALVDSSQGKTRHIPYRESKLTYLLRDSLGGNAKTSLIATVSPTRECYTETAATLKFAESAKLVKNRAIINENSGSLSQLQMENKSLRETVAELQLANKLLTPVDGTKITFTSAAECIIGKWDAVMRDVVKKEKPVEGVTPSVLAEGTSVAAWQEYIARCKETAIDQAESTAAPRVALQILASTMDKLTVGGSNVEVSIPLPLIAATTGVTRLNELENLVQSLAQCVEVAETDARETREKVAEEEQLRVALETQIRCDKQLKAKETAAVPAPVRATSGIPAPSRISGSASREPSPAATSKIPMPKASGIPRPASTTPAASTIAPASMALQADAAVVAELKSELELWKSKAENHPDTARVAQLERRVRELEASERTISSLQDGAVIALFAEEYAKALQEVEQLRALLFRCNPDNFAELLAKYEATQTKHVQALQEAKAMHKEAEQRLQRQLSELFEELQESRQTSAEFMSICQQLTSDKTKLDTMNNELTIAAATMKVQLNLETDKARRIEAELCALKESDHDLKQATQRSDEAIQGLQQQLQASATALASAQSDLLAETQQKQQLEAKLKDMEHNCAKLTAAVEAQRRETQEAREQIAQLQQTERAAIDNAQQTAALLDAKVAELQGFQAVIHSHKQETAGFQDQIHKLERQIEVLHMEIAANDDNVAYLEEQRDMYRKDLHAAEEQLETLRASGQSGPAATAAVDEAVVAQLHARIAEMHARIEALSGELATATSTITQSKAEEAGARETNVRLQQELTEIQTQLESAKSEAASVCANAATMEASLRQQITMLEAAAGNADAALQNELTAMKEQHNGDVATITSLQARIASMEEFRQQAEKAVDDMQASYLARIAQLEEQIALEKAHRSEQDDATTRLAALQASYDALHTQAQNDRTTLETSMQELKQRAIQLEEENKFLQTKVATLEAMQSNNNNDEIITQQQQQLTALQSELASVRGLLAEQTARAEAAQAQVAELEATFSNAEKAVDAMQQSYRTHIEQLQTQIQQLQDAASATTGSSAVISTPAPASPAPAATSSSSVLQPLLFSNNSNNTSNNNYSYSAFDLSSPSVPIKTRHSTIPVTVSIHTKATLSATSRGKATIEANSAWASKKLAENAVETGFLC